MSVRPFEFRCAWTDAKHITYPKTIWRPRALLVAANSELAAHVGESDAAWAGPARTALMDLFSPARETRDRIVQQYGVLDHAAHPNLRAAVPGSVVNYNGSPALILTDEFVHREHRLGFALAAPLVPASGGPEPKGVIRCRGSAYADWRIAYELIQKIEPRHDAQFDVERRAAVGSAMLGTAMYFTYLVSSARLPPGVLAKLRVS